MKKIIATMTMIAAIMCSFQSEAQIDRSKAPQPGPAPKIEFGDHEKFTMKNGLRVIVVEDHERPIVSATMTFLTDPSVEGNKSGLTQIFGALWEKGTTSMSADEISEATDFLGARFHTSSTSVSFTSLAKYTDRLMSITADVLLNPTFPQEEMDKIKTQINSMLEANRTDPSTILSNIKTASVYESDHPYSDIMTAATVANITVADCREYYDTNIKPNNAILVFVGDITYKEAKKIATKYLGKWEKGEVIKKEYSKVQKPQGINVVFSPKDGAVQSSIAMMSPVELKPGAPDLLAAGIANFIYGGGGFSAKLMKNLREDKGYTYGAYSSLSPDKISAEFEASGEVNKDATDSSFMEMRKELIAMQKGEFDDIDFVRAKKAYAGSFSRSLEDPATLARFALSIERYGLPEDYYATYLQRLDAVTREDVQDAVHKFMDPDNCYYFVVGDESVLDGLKKLDTDGNIEILNHEGKPIDKKEISSDITVEKIYERYLQYIGGRDLAEGIRDITEVMSMNLMGMQVVSTTVRIPEKEAMSISQSVGGNIMQKIVLKDGILSITMQGNTQKVSDKSQIEAFMSQLLIFPELGAIEGTSLAGIEEVNGKEAYKVKVERSGMTEYAYYDIATGAKLKSVTVSGQNIQEVFFEDYEITKYGIAYPMTQKTIMSQGSDPVEVKVTEVKINQGIKALPF